MSFTSRSSLFTRAPHSGLQASVAWIERVLFEDIAVAFCVVAVAFVGALMLRGRLAFERAIKVVFGCFLLLGAPVIATAFLELSERGSGYSPAYSTRQEADLPRQNLPPANHDPYAGASLGRE